MAKKVENCQNIYDAAKLTCAESSYLLNGNVYTVSTGVDYDSLNRIKCYTQNGVVTSYEYLPMGMVDKTATAGGCCDRYCRSCCRIFLRGGNGFRL